MSTTLQTSAPDVPAGLDANGWAILEQALTADQCRAVASLYDDDRLFRSRSSPSQTMISRAASSC